MSSVACALRGDGRIAAEVVQLCIRDPWQLPYPRCHVPKVGRPSKRPIQLSNVPTAEMPRFPKGLPPLTKLPTLV